MSNEQGGDKDAVKIPTPRTDAQDRNPLDSTDYRAWRSFARQLEIELDGLRAMYRSACAMIEQDDAARSSGVTHVEANAAAYRVFTDRTGLQGYATWKDVRACISAYVEASRSATRENVIEECAKICDAEATWSLGEAIKAKKEDRHVTANLLSGKRDSIVTCAAKIRFLKRGEYVEKGSK